ncbi:MAG TPA: hypothetical protein VFN55_13315 [Solirubrobacteraceae bacterium]|nr:hypothetical protein [Solirubrobacteraceae bacterium]
MRSRRPPLRSLAEAAILLTVALTVLGIVTPLGAGAPGGPALARADGDPASDVLLGDNVFYPYSPATPRPIQLRLNAILAKARAQGFPIKVALIAAPTDLGVIPDLFGKPGSYAKFLDQEISFQGRQRLLVVMAAGYGIQAFPAAAQAALDSLPRPDGRTAAALARAAIVAVPRLAAASGHPIRGLPAAAANGGGSGDSRTVVAVGLAVAAVLVAGALLVLRRRTAPVP